MFHSDLHAIRTEFQNGEMKSLFIFFFSEYRVVLENLASCKRSKKIGRLSKKCHLEGLARGNNLQ